MSSQPSMKTLASRLNVSVTSNEDDEPNVAEVGEDYNEDKQNLRN